MAPLRALLVTTILLAGCQGANPPGPTDPFFGRTRIEPPHTGAVPGPSAVAPYSPAAPQVTLPPAMMPMPGASSTLEPSSSLVVRQSSDPIAIPAAARQMESPRRQIASRSATSGESKPGASDESSKTATAIPVAIAKTASPVVSAGAQETPVADRRDLAGAAGRERVYQTISPRPKEATALLTGPSPLRTAASASSSSNASASGRSIDIMDLPPPNNIQLVSAIVEVNDPAGQGTTATTQGSTLELSVSPSLYGYDPQYGWVRGRLEYSQIDHRWKLRYIPVDGVTDRFGGSVILANTAVLSGYERGDFVEVQGALADTNPNNRTFSPTFEVQTIKLVRK